MSTETDEWTAWQAAWQTALPQKPIDAARLLARHRNAARLYTALDVVAALIFCALGLLSFGRSLPIVVAGTCLIVFSLVLLAYAVWNRRDALFVSDAPTSDFIGLLRLRLERRVRLLRFVAGFVVAEIAFTLAFFAVWFPERLAVAAGAYLIMAVLMVPLFRQRSRRLADERAKLELLALGMMR